MENFINHLYDLLRIALIYMCKAVDMTYKEINILIFCVIGPIVFLIMFVLIVKQYYNIKALTFITKTFKK